MPYRTDDEVGTALGGSDFLDAFFEKKEKEPKKKEKRTEKESNYGRTSDDCRDFCRFLYKVSNKFVTLRP